MSEKEAFAEYIKRIGYDESEQFYVRKGWQARGAYEVERAKKLVEAIRLITHRPNDESYVLNTVTAMQEKAIREYEGGK